MKRMNKEEHKLFRMGLAFQRKQAPKYEVKVRRIEGRNRIKKRVPEDIFNFINKEEIVVDVINEAL